MPEKTYQKPHTTPHIRDTTTLLRWPGGVEVIPAAKHIKLPGPTAIKFHSLSLTPNGRTKRLSSSHQKIILHSGVLPIHPYTLLVLLPILPPLQTIRRQCNPRMGCRR